MDVATILSDLTSLRACDHSAALALVSARLAGVQTPGNKPADVDLDRAYELLKLHQTVKLGYSTSAGPQGAPVSISRELTEARKSVQGVVQKLGTKTSNVESTGTMVSSTVGQGDDKGDAEDEEEAAAWS